MSARSKQSKQPRQKVRRSNESTPSTKGMSSASSASLEQNELPAGLSTEREGNESNSKPSNVVYKLSLIHT